MRRLAAWAHTRRRTRKSLMTIRHIQYIFPDIFAKHMPKPNLPIHSSACSGAVRWKREPLFRAAHRCKDEKKGVGAVIFL
jgi:hypothetical protein